MNPDGRRLGFTGALCRCAFLAGAAYWLVYVLVAPVTNVDSQMYDISRLALAMKGGLFNNDLFTSYYQLMWPWTFDAVHLPFLLLGWGYALPSFLCLMGTCAVAFQLIRERFGPQAGWVAVAALLGLTCLAYQGSSTKNDIPVLFAGAVWLLARARWRRGHQPGQVFWMVLSIGFMSGSKTTGLLYGAVLAAWTVWDLRDHRPLATRAFLGILVSVLLFGSVETYVESARVFGHPLGPPRIVEQLRNPDGGRGFAANLSRYVVGSVYLGPTHLRTGPPAVLALADRENAFLTWTGLGDAGVAPFLRGERPFFVQSGFEELSGFGPVGTAAMATMVAACFIWRPKELWWRLAIGGFAVLATVSFTVAFNDWANRYLICSYSLGTAALACFLWNGSSRPRLAGRWILAVTAAASVVSAPLFSFNRGPAALVASLTDREQVETSMNPVMGKVRLRLRALKAADPQDRVFYIVRSDSAILPILEDRTLDAVLVTPTEFIRLVAAGRLKDGDLVIEDLPLGLPALVKLDEVSGRNVLTEDSTVTMGIFRYVGPAAPGAAK